MNRLTILNPEVAQQVTAVDGAPRPAGLQDVVVGFVDNSKQNADLFVERLRASLHDRYGIVAGIKVRKHAPKDELSAGDLEELRKCAAVVQCYGD